VLKDRCGDPVAGDRVHAERMRDRSHQHFKCCDDMYGRIFHNPEEGYMRTVVVVLVGGLAIGLTGCTKSNGPTSSGEGTMQLKMVDRPANYDAVNIVIDSVDAHIAGSDSTSGWMSLNSSPGTYDLLLYTNGNFAVVGDAEMPAGRYSQIRLKLGSGSNVVVNGQTYPLTVASGFESGIKLNVDATVQANATWTMTFDFDANQSVVQTGDSVRAEFMLKPVLRATAEGTSGFIAGVVLPITAQATVWGYSSAGDTVSTNADVAGAFELSLVPVGSYSLHIVSNNALYLDSTLTGINVNALATANVGTVILKPS